MFISATEKMNEPTITPIERLDFRLVEWQWPFAHDRAAEIEAHFRTLNREKPALWNGRVFMLRDYEISNDLLRGHFFETGFAELLAWRDWGYPDQAIRACFAMAAIETADKGFLLGVMGEHTANPGKIYFPTGTPDADDLYEDRVDLDKSVRRELAEETGLEFEMFEAESGWHVVFSGHHIALIKRLRSQESARQLRSRVLAFLARDRQPEFSDMRTVHGPDDLTPKIPPYVRAFLEQVWHERRPRA
jgi:8-oxo-dGTP pyrophosphatase MutT (NUDIX family)